MKNIDFSNLKVIYVNYTLKKYPQESHTSTLMNVSKKNTPKRKCFF